MVRVNLGLGEVNAETHNEQYIGLDFETYSDVDLVKHGTDRYFASEHFTPLIAATFSIDDDGQGHHDYFDFWDKGVWSPEVVQRLEQTLVGRIVVGHNVAFEEAVLKHLGLHHIPDGYVDSAVAARMMGASSSLARCAPQLLGRGKVSLGEHLIKLFSVPGRYQEANGSPAFNPHIALDYEAEWDDFMYYCKIDAELSLFLWFMFIEKDGRAIQIMEEAAATRRMNGIGWPVDTELVEQMKERVEENVTALKDKLKKLPFLEGEWANLNVASTPQLQRFCKARGIRAKSFDEKHTAKMMAKIKERLEDDTKLSASKRQQLAEVLAVLEIKKELGGAATAKLPKILDLVGHDGRLRDNYLHAGAGQTGRTTGKGVQMQNLPQLREVRSVLAVDTWTNEQVARNLRQVFTASHEDGYLVVGDFSSVEARALAGLAQEEKILDAYAKGLDLYKVGAADHYKIPYEEVSKEQRKFGKVGVLSCGYGAGNGAVQSFAEGMGIMLSPLEAQMIVDSWRDGHPMTVAFWTSLEKAFREALEYGGPVTEEQSGIVFRRSVVPTSLLRKLGAKWSISMDIPREDPSEKFLTYATRWFHGVYLDSSYQIIYHKPVDAKTKEQLWTDEFTDKQGRTQKYKLYGGKLAGIATQSYCREMFFTTILRLEKLLDRYPNAQIIGQFHDELVVDWWPDERGISLEDLENMMRREMGPKLHRRWPMAAEVNHAYRYLK